MKSQTRLAFSARANRSGNHPRHLLARMPPSCRDMAVMLIARKRFKASGACFAGRIQPARRRLTSYDRFSLGR